MSGLPDDGMPAPAKMLGALGFTLHELLRYGYGGLLALVLAGWYDPDHTKTTIDALGVVITTLAAFAGGAALYVASRHTVGPATVVISESLYGLLLHRGWADTRTRYHFFRERFGMGVLKAEDAWRAVWRRSLWSPERQHTFYRQHSEIHALYVTSLVFLLCGFWNAWAVLWGLLVAIVGGFADVMVSRQECLVLHEHQSEIREILIQSGLIRADQVQLRLPYA